MRNLILFVVVPLLTYALKPTNENVTPFDSVDSNLNGAIDFWEFENWYRSRSQADDYNAKRLFRKFDVDNSENLDITEFVPLAFEISKKPIDTEQAIFRQLDANGDNVIDLQEAALARKQMDGSIIDGLLTVADTNRDGQLTINEFTAQLTYERPQQQLDEKREMALRLLAFIDTNADNKLDPKEVYRFASQGVDREILKVFLMLDKNRDAFLSLQEIERVPASIVELLQIDVDPPMTV